MKNKDLENRAYEDITETKIGRMRSMHHLLGLVDRQDVALDRGLFAHVKSSALIKLTQ